jgi:hypothetical protein
VTRPAVTVPPAPAAAGVIDRARTLYLSANYEEALGILSGPRSAGSTEAADTYVALCLVGLNRMTEAEQVFERLLARNSNFQLTDASPRVLSMVDGIRHRVLLQNLEARYAQARADYDAGRRKDAGAEFDQVVAASNNSALAADPRVDDLRRLATEYRHLAGLSSAAKAPQPEDTTRLFTRLDTDVHPPVALQRPMPDWNPPRELAWRSFRGVIELVVNEQGTVDDARMIERLAPFYDGPLLEAARSWRFKPAMQNGTAVRFRLQQDIVMRPPP